MKTYELRNRLMHRDTPFRVLVEEDHDSNPREADCYTEDDFKKFDSGEYRTWEYVIYRTCPDHEGMACPHSLIIDSLCGMDVLDDRDLEGDYTSPYFIENDYVRDLVWDNWRTREQDYADAVRAEQRPATIKLRQCSACGTLAEPSRHNPERCEACSSLN